MPRKLNSRFVTSSDGASIYADAVGDPEAPSVVFIHGLALSCVVFDNIFLETDFSGTFYLIRYDLRGHGRSAKPDGIEGYSSKLHADDFAAVCTAFGLRKPVLVGWSLGATVLADVAAYLPTDFLSGAVCLAGLPLLGPNMERVRRPDPTILGLTEGFFSEDVKLWNRTSIAFVDTLFAKPEEIPWALKCQWIGMSVFQSPNNRPFVLSRQQDVAKLNELGESGLPLLVLFGMQDRHVNGDAIVAELKPHFKRMKVCTIEESGGHAVHFENVGEVLASIGSFVREIFGSSH